MRRGRGNRIITYANGDIRYVNKAGKTHRVGGPAYITPCGDLSWYVNGKLHNIDGPAHVRTFAFVNSDVFTAWYVCGVRCFNFEEIQRVGVLSDEHMMVLRLKYGSDLK
jgi:hypothetical protein